MKNALLLMSELFSSKRDKEFAVAVKEILPLVLIKTVYEKNFIVVEAKKCMQLSVMNCCFSETMEVLIEGCCSKNGTMAELAMGYLQTLIKHINPEILLEHSETTQKLCRQLISDYEGKRMKMKKGAETAFQELKNAIGVQRMQTVLTESVDESDTAKQQIAKIMKLFEQKQQTKTDKSKDFRSFLKNQKQQIPKDDESAYSKTEDVEMKVERE